MTAWICATCGVQHAPADAPPARCPVCEDARQYVPPGGQRWTSAAELRAGGHACDVRPEADLTGIGVAPPVAIGQRALLVPCEGRALLWDCVPVCDEAAVAAVQAAGGLCGIAISHPHFHAAMVDWAERFDCPIHVHAADARWVMRDDPRVQLWDGERNAVGEGVTLVRAGGHFPGGTVLHRAGGAGGAGTLLTGDIVMVVPDRAHVSFMWSYPNLVPLAEHDVRAVAAAVAPLPFESIVGGWWGTVIPAGGRGIVARSAERYCRALRGQYPS